MVDFLPTPEKDGSVCDDKLDARVTPGLFMGWKLAPGGRWTGEYHVVDLQQFVAHLHDGRVVGEQTIKEVYCQELASVPLCPFVFPARDAFEKQMRAIPDDVTVPLPHSEPQQHALPVELPRLESAAEGKPLPAQTRDHWVMQEDCVIRKHIVPPTFSICS